MKVLSSFPKLTAINIKVADYRNASWPSTQKVRAESTRMAWRTNPSVKKMLVRRTVANETVGLLPRLMEMRYTWDCSGTMSREENFREMWYVHT